MNDLMKTSADVQDTSGKYLTFTLQHESYGIEVLKVREIIRLTEITSVAKMPNYVRGVINLRGKIIPVIDLQMRLGFASIQNTELTCIVVANVKLRNGQSIQMGLMVEGVEEVLNIATADIEEAPDFGANIETNYIRGMAKVKGAVKTLLDIDNVLGGEAVQQISAARA